MTNALLRALAIVALTAPLVLAADDPAQPKPESSGNAHSAVKWKKIKLNDKFYSEGAAFGDFNHDGKMDIVSGPFWYEGPDFSPDKKHEYAPVKTFDGRTGYSDNFFAFTYDFNGDGWDDILIIGFPGVDASWYENPKGKDGHWTRHVALDVVDNESPTFVDLIGAGKPQLVCNSGGYFGYAAPDWKDPSRPWTFHKISPKGNWQRFTHGLGVGDVNGDGKMDLLEAHGWWEQPASLEGDPVWKHHAFQFFDPGNGDGTSQMYAYDVNGDGKNDVICALQAHGYGLAWFEQKRDGKGEITFEKHLIMGKTAEENPQGAHFSQLHAVDLIDIDGDGLKDIVTGKRHWAHGDHGDPEPTAPGMLYWFQLVREGGKAHFVAHQIDDDSGVGTQVMAGDVSGDGKPDIVVGNKSGTFVFIQQR